MKKLLTLPVLFAACTLMLWAGLFNRSADSSDGSGFRLPPISISADAASAQDYFLKTGSYQINADIRMDISQIFQLRLPVNVTFKKGTWMADCGLMITGYPVDNCGFNLGVNLIQAGYRQGKYYALNEIVSGWTFRFKDRYFVEPQIAVRDPSGAFKDEYAEILGIFPCYKNFRVRLLCGIKLL